MRQLRSRIERIERSLGQTTAQQAADAKAKAAWASLFRVPPEELPRRAFDGKRWVDFTYVDYVRLCDKMRAEDQGQQSPAS